MGQKDSRKNARDKFFHDTKTPKGNFWEIYGDELLGPDFWSSKDPEVIPQKSRLSPWETFSPAARSNCAILHEEAEDILAILPQEWRNKFDKVFFGRTLEPDEAARSHAGANEKRFVAVSARYTSLLPATDKLIALWNKKAASAKMSDSYAITLNNALDEIRQNAQAVFQKAKIGRPFDLESTPFQSWVPTTEGNPRHIHHWGPETWMIAHELAHFLYRNGKLDPRNILSPSVRTIISDSMIGEELNILPKKWVKEIMCDVIACRMLNLYYIDQRKLDPAKSHYKEVAYWAVVALTTVDFVNKQFIDPNPSNPHANDEQPSHPPLFIRVRILFAVLARDYQNSPHYIERERQSDAERDFYSFCATLWDFSRWATDPFDLVVAKMGPPRNNLQRNQKWAAEYFSKYAIDAMDEGGYIAWSAISGYSNIEVKI